MADTKASAFTSTTTAASTDVLPIVTGIGGTPANKIISVGNLGSQLTGIPESAVTNLTTDLAGKAAVNADTTGKSAKTDALNSATTVVDVSAATAPTSGQVLTATSGTAATWQTPASSFADPTTTKGDIITSAGSGAVRLGVGTDTYVLTADSTATNGIKWAAPAAGGGGQTLVTKVVAASGGDYTTLGAALAAASSGWVIHVYPGTYTESAITSTVTNVTIVGAGPESSILSFGANALTMSGTLVRFINIGMTFTTGGIALSGTYAEVMGCHLYQTSVSSTQLLNIANYGTLENSYLSRPVDSTGQCIYAASYFTMTGNRVESGQGSNGEVLNVAAYGNVVGNAFHLTSGGNSGTAMINLNGGVVVFSGNHVYTEYNLPVGQFVLANSGDATITGNQFYGGGSNTYGIYYNASNGTISGNQIHLRFSGGKGIELAGANGAVTGNLIEFDAATGTTGIDLKSGAGADNCLITGNRITNANNGIVVTTGTNKTVVVANSVVGFVTAGVSDSGTGSVVASNAT